MTQIKLRLLILAMALLAFPSALQAQQHSKLIYNVLIQPPKGSVSSTDVDFLRKNVLPIAIRTWNDNCTDEEFSVLDFATGSFTAAQKSQKIFLYTCFASQMASKQGIVVVENGNVVAHVLFEGVSSSIGALPDINQNGINEILIPEGSEEDERTLYISKGFYIVELTANDVEKLGRFNSYANDCGMSALTNTKTSMTAQKIYVTIQSKPIFYSETFVKPCKGRWRKATKKLIKPSDIGTEFRRLK